MTDVCNAAHSSKSGPKLGVMISRALISLVLRHFALPEVRGYIYLDELPVASPLYSKYSTTTVCSHGEGHAALVVSVVGAW